MYLQALLCTPIQAKSPAFRPDNQTSERGHLSCIWKKKKRKKNKKKKKKKKNTTTI
jgi:hypothetical protein